MLSKVDHREPLGLRLIVKEVEEMEVIRWNHWRIGRTGKRWRLGRHKEGLRGSALGEAQVITIFFDNKDEFF